MRPIFLIRHVAVDIAPGTPAAEWRLSEEGRAAAERLATLPIFAGIGALYTSPEGKARATGAPLARRYGLALTSHPDLAELRRGSTHIAGRAAYEAAVAAAFALPDGSADGWEPAAAAQRRIVACVRELAARERGPFAIVSHGLVLSLLAAALAGQPRVDLAAWRALPLPALAVLNADTWQLAAPFSPVDIDA